MRLLIDVLSPLDSVYDNFDERESSNALRHSRGGMTKLTWPRSSSRSVNGNEDGETGFSISCNLLDNGHDVFTRKVTAADYRKA